MGRSMLAFVRMRPIIPVRAIPFVTGWNYSPDAIAQGLARTSAAPFDVLGEIQAQHLVNKEVVPILPKEWDGVVTKLLALEKTLKSEQMDDDIGYAKWRRKSVEALPADAFIWLDEFEAEFERCNARVLVNPSGERLGERALNYSPILDDEQSNTVLAGFIEQLERLGPSPVDTSNRDGHYFTIHEAVQALVKQGAISQPQAEMTSGDLLEAVQRGELTVRRPDTLLPYKPRTPRGDWEVIKLEDFNAWLDKYHLPYRLDVPTIAEGEGEAESTGKLVGITKEQVLIAFASYKNIDSLKRGLSDPPKWLKACRATLGRPGSRRSGATWDPVALGVELLGRGATLKQIDAAFKKNNFLAPFLPEWEEKSEHFRMD